MERRMKKAIRELEEVQREERRGRVGWWDKEAKEKKREVRAELRKWRARGKGRSIERRTENTKSYASERGGKRRRNG